MMQKVHIGRCPQPIINLLSDPTLENRLSRTRRVQQFFNVPHNRLKTADNAISYKGPKFYNLIVNQINSDILANPSYKQPLVQNKFYDPFKRCVKYHLLRVQSEGDALWDFANFPLYHDL